MHVVTADSLPVGSTPTMAMVTLDRIVINNETRDTFGHTANQFSPLLEKEDCTTAYADTAASGHFVPEGCIGKPLRHSPMEVRCANNNSMTSSATIELDMPSLMPEMKKATVFKDIAHPLFSIPEVADQGCEVTLVPKNDMDVKDRNNDVILQGW